MITAKDVGITILIADRNPRVRDFLKREMTREGYIVELAENPAQLLQAAQPNGEPFALIIVDPDFPGASAAEMIERLVERDARVPVIIHSHDAGAGLDPAGWAPQIRRVEKGGSSVERLKQLAAELLKS